MTIPDDVSKAAAVADLLTADTRPALLRAWFTTLLADVQHFAVGTEHEDGSFTLELRSVTGVFLERWETLCERDEHEQAA